MGDKMRCGRMGLDEYMEGQVVKVVGVDKSCPELCFEGLMVVGEIYGKTGIYFLCSGVML